MKQNSRIERKLSYKSDSHDIRHISDTGLAGYSHNNLESQIDIITKNNRSKNNRSKNNRSKNSRSSKINRSTIMISAIALAALIVIISLSISFNASAETTSIDTHKFFTSIEVKEGDTLWSIATKYISPEYQNINTYIDELKQMNNLKDDTIHAGNCIIVSYYNK